ncbi:helix-turn-helix domain-containing protein [Thermoleptolyngbya sichuanensis XZ-Cy5]|uniref:helix-turn-helix domain-containing protein n=1 Tax=Thermoleptolyngbya sichuanensis TaxID=2885951 RepID=UPI00240E412F|nr:helix-turn-helix domain-containing protein [Thermoleptolyngbya sichuanensis]MDG2617780.1 helix-turn-helix domain-containing protein [Thermoleptolyngbya sichuanensis XZ-Cy5]
MAYTVKDGCIACDRCRPQCPTGAIKTQADNGYWIDPTLCDRCVDLDTPRCVEACTIGSLAPLQPKKGRNKSTLLPAAIPSLFLNGKTTPFASCMVVWEACNLLAQRQSLPWQADDDGCLTYRRTIHRGQGELRFRLATDPEALQARPIDYTLEIASLTQFDLRAACLHLIFAAQATTCDRPWAESFVLNDQHIEQYLGLHRRKDLTKLERLTLIKTLVYQTCRVLVSLDWPRQGKVQGFSLDEHPVWQLLHTQYYFETDAEGCRHLIGLSFTVQAGAWAQRFLNRQDYRRQTAFYQYGTLPQSLLTEVMGNWQQHEGAMRLLLWLVFKLRLGSDHRITIRTLLRIAYGEDRLTEALTVRGAHKRLIKTFENDLEALYHYGLRPQFDPDTYPPVIQPLWARVADIPDDAEAALNFWTDDAHSDLSLTDRAPRDKGQRLLNARLLGFELSEDWRQSVGKARPKRRRSPKSTPPQQAAPLSGAAIKSARQRQNLSQRALAERLGKSQSWIRDVENGRFSLGASDRTRMQEALGLV